eukprot:8428218-Alexandrium_andersonii.AAC.1
MGLRSPARSLGLASSVHRRTRICGLPWRPRAERRAPWHLEARAGGPGDGVGREKRTPKQQDRGGTLIRASAS